MIHPSLIKEVERAKQAASQFHFCEEYYQIHSPSKCSIALHPENQIKNKQNHWGFPYDHNRILSIPSYINASPMEFNSRRYIAAQGPRDNTLAEFWHMVLAEKATLVISVTNERENTPGMGSFKFNRFWPSEGSLSYGDVRVTLVEESLLNEWNDGREEKIRMRRLLLTHENEKRAVVHLHMENWPDNGVVHPESLLQLSREANRLNDKGPIIVHCAAGVGRTGTFIAFHSLYNDLVDQSSHPNPSVDIPGRVHAMRQLRWGAMIADIKQYELLLEALKLSLTQLAVHNRNFEDFNRS